MGRTLLVVFRWGIFLLACAFLWAQWSADKGRSALEALGHLDREGVLPGLLLGMLLLMALNWGIEAGKWRWLVAPVERVGLRRAIAATLAGASVGLITPNRTGEFVGRVLFLGPRVRAEGAFATALGSIAQFLVTLTAGACGMLVLHVKGAAFPWADGRITLALLSLTLLVACCALVLYLFPSLLRQLLMVLPVLRRLERASSVLNTYGRRELLVVLFLSTLRYLVFAGQYVWLLRVFDAGTPAEDALFAVPLIYLVSTLVPTVMLTELGVRSSVAVAVMLPLGGSGPAVVMATTLLWTINVALPAVIGSVVLLIARIRTEKTTP